jgi:phenylalanyl-tRNA synthetase alpha chain
MTDTQKQLPILHKQAIEDLEKVKDAPGLEVWRIQYIGRKGEITLALKEIKELPAEERKEAGRVANEVRQNVLRLYQEKSTALGGPTAETKTVDIQAGPGHLHPLTLTMQRIQDIFSAMGFAYVEGPDVEEQKYNFDLLNIPVTHPARAETDTFYIKDLEGSDEKPLILRTHVSPQQIRGPVEGNKKPPFKIFYFGRTFRSEKSDATHESTFHQLEFMIVSETASIADLKKVIQTFYSTFFQKPVDVRLRPSYFPFVEPGVEVDMSCVFCNGDGCHVCKHTGWIEMAGAGSVHPHVLKNINVDPTKYQGLALGGGVDRLAMLYYGVNDLRLFWSDDIRFLRQFS